MTTTKRHPGHIAALPIAVAMTSSCFFINLPLIPLFFQSFEGAPQILLGPTLAISFALSALLGPFWGRLADQYGYRLMMQRASGLLVLTYVVTALVPNAEALFVARVLNGLASGFIPAATAYAIRATGEHKRNRTLTTLSAARNSGAVFGPALGALFAAWWGFRAAAGRKASKSSGARCPMRADPPPVVGSGGFAEGHSRKMGGGGYLIE
ncbi:Major Facilitator Superfamily protein [Austwickia chelonae]|nr:Major Facilitator Superfamily protein [Austwickia chelonae]